jgi:Right handed beta helix region
MAARGEQEEGLSTPPSKWSRIALLLGLAGLAVVVSEFAQQPPTAGSAPKCDRYASVHGNDRAPGTASRPVSSPQRLVHILRPGERGCLGSGTYSFGTLVISTPSITLRPRPGAKPRLKGEVKALPSAAGSAIVGLSLDSSSGNHRIGPRIYADRFVLRDNDITSRRRGICVHVTNYFDKPGPSHVRIIGNRIHGCGRRPVTNQEHGIYVADAHRTQIRRNWIYRNADRGIQLYPSATATRVVGNVIDSNGQGVSMGGLGGTCSNDNLILRNVIAHSRISWNVYSNADGNNCTGNVVAFNCVSAGRVPDHYSGQGGVESPSRNFTADDNTIARPRYTNPGAGNFRLRPGSRCARFLSR